MSKPLSLVTGACGFMGGHMAEVLHEAGHRIRATDLADAGEKDDKKTGRFPSILKKVGAEFIPSDMTRPETLAPLVEGVDYVFHIASVFNYTATWDLLHRVNVLGCRALVDLAAAQKSLKRFVLWGAGGVYGVPEPWMLPFTEDLAPNPPNNYQRSKWMQEYYVMEKGRTAGLPYSIMRPTSVYGPRCVYGTGPMFMQAAQMKTVAAPANFTTHLPFVHVIDVCKAALYLAENEGAKNEIFNLNDDSQMTQLEFMEFMAEINGHKFVKLPPIPVEPLKMVLVPLAAQITKLWRKFGSGPSPLEPDILSMLGKDFTYSNEKLKKIGYRFAYPDAHDGIRDTIRWYRDEGWIQ
jgi:dihydroflavonol-4-reductase